MAKAFVDTTILADLLLKAGSAVQSAEQALGRYERSLLPAYAIKEFKAGPLSRFVWLYNKLTSGSSFSEALHFLQRESRTQRRYLTSTALEALHAAATSIGAQTTPDLVAKYGAKAELNAILRDEFRYAVKYQIFHAWQERRSRTDEVVDELTCYTERDPREGRGGLIDLEPKSCAPKTECCLAARLRAAPNDLERLRRASDQLPNKPENARRSRVLKTLIKHPKQRMTHEMCKALGDAIFAFFCPADAVLLTTNLSDHRALAEALGKRAEGPDASVGSSKDGP